MGGQPRRRAVEKEAGVRSERCSTGPRAVYNARLHVTPPASARSNGGLQAADLPAEPGAAPRPLVASLLVGLGGLVAGVTGPLLSAFVPPLVQGTLGDRGAAIGGVLAIDNVLLLLLTPWAGAVSDRLIDRGRGRLPLILAGLLLAAAGMTIFPASAGLGLTGVVAAIVLLYGGINIQRSPFQALIPDLYRRASDRSRPDRRRFRCAPERSSS